MCILWILASLGTHYLYAGLAAIAIATTWNFLLNDALTWGDLPSSSVRAKALRYLKYWMVTGVASLVQVSLLFLLTSVGLSYLASNLCGIGAATVWNFRTNCGWTWKLSRPATAPVYGVAKARYGQPTGGIQGRTSLAASPSAAGGDPNESR